MQTRAEQSGAPVSPVVLSSGEGSNVLDVDGNMYVDLAAGFGVLLLGHRPARIGRALTIQAERLSIALGDLYPSDAKIALLEKLAALYPGKNARVLLGQSGGDAISAALKTAKLATGKPGVIAFEGAYHGLGYGPLPLLGLHTSWREAFADQISPHVRFVPYPADEEGAGRTLSAVAKALGAGDVGAIVVEPILGRGGCVLPPESFGPELRALASGAGALVVADEIWTGLGRSGHWLASHAMGLEPDLVCLGKGLGGGLPISACIGSESAMRGWDRRGADEVIHTATFHGAPLAAATAIATLDALRQAHLVERSAEVGRRVLALLRGKLADVPGASVRGSGLMIGVALGAGATALVVQRALLEAGYIVTLGGRDGEVLVLTPALNISESLFDGFGTVLRDLLEGRPGSGGAR